MFKKIILFGLIVPIMVVQFPVAVTHAKATKGQIVKTLHRINVYRGKEFRSSPKVGTYPVGKKIPVKRVVTAGGMTRFQLVNGHYITANKKYVQLIH
ncbi:DUF5776 domain-containing protein [Lactobacillus sp. Sy-1]|uniref:DUF5776 domain-containing protein n=1 Tax=Lactobacillus sp. Sy-1 TaxID=2109645 RepID=UPI002103F306|nr:DUF5776 domain-containing protein [Lactobacillus sp. Sy-1]MBW1606150.1 hypothetical protein [Lactobacillus sp. Sy-1]